MSEVGVRDTLGERDVTVCGHLDANKKKDDNLDHKCRTFCSCMPTISHQRHAAPFRSRRLKK